MTEDLSLWALIIGASLPVQLVMLILFLASVISWTMIVQRGLYLRHAEQHYRDFEETFWSGVDLNQLYSEIDEKIHDNIRVDGLESVFRSGFREFNRLMQQRGGDPEMVMEGTERAKRVALSREEAQRPSAVSGERRLREPLYRVVRHRLGHHAVLPGTGQCTAGHPRHGGSGDRRGAYRHCHGAVRRDPGGAGVQPIRRLGGTAVQ